MQTTPGGVLEIRDYALYADKFKDFLTVSAQYAEARRTAYPGFVGMFSADTGGNVSRVVHLYHFKDYNSRDLARKAASRDPAWQAYTDAARTCIQSKESTMLLQAPPELYAAARMGCASAFQPRLEPPGDERQAVYELRTYQLQPDRSAVSQLYGAFQTGLPAKLAADGVGQLALVGHSDVGRLHTVYELWRYPSTQDLIDACGRTRSAPAWQDAKATAYSLCRDFTITFLRPTAFSPWQ